MNFTSIASRSIHSSDLLLELSARHLSRFIKSYSLLFPPSSRSIILTSSPMNRPINPAAIPADLHQRRLVRHGASPFNPTDRRVVRQGPDPQPHWRSSAWNTRSSARSMPSTATVTGPSPCAHGRLTAPKGSPTRWATTSAWCTAASTQAIRPAPSARGKRPCATADAAPSSSQPARGAATVQSGR